MMGQIVKCPSKGYLSQTKVVGWWDRWDTTLIGVSHVLSYQPQGVLGMVGRAKSALSLACPRPSRERAPIGPAAAAHPAGNRPAASRAWAVR